MILIPDDDWRWIFDEQRQKLLLDLSDEMQFCACLPVKQLACKEAFTQTFDLDDYSLYYHFLECLGEFPFSDPERVLITLNAIAAVKYAKPLVCHSWLYRTADLVTCATETGEVYSVFTNFGYADVMVISAGENASLCILLSPKLQVEADTLLHQSAVFKLLNAKLVPYQAAEQYLARQAV